MLRFLQSIFRRGARAGAVPDSLVNKAIERAVDGTDPWIRGVFGYKKKLRPAVMHAIEHVVALVDGTGPILPLDPQRFDQHPNLGAYFISASELRQFMEHDPALTQLRATTADGRHGATGLLVMEKRERLSLGAEVAGEVVLRDVPQVTVSFEAHQLLDLNGREEETRYQLKRRAYDHLLRIALGRITEIKTRRGVLEKHRTLLGAKLTVLRRGGFGFDRGSGAETDVTAIEKSLADIEAQLLAIGKDDKMLEVYLGVVADVLGRAEEHLWLGEETLMVDRMGIKRKEARAGVREVKLDVLCDAEGRKLVFSLVSIPA